MKCLLGSTILACALLPLSPLNAQSITVARNAALGSQVTVTGIVTNGPSLGGIRYLQDDGAGIAAFPGSGSVPGFSPPQGANITVTGTLAMFNGLLEITPIASFNINSTGNPLPAPLLITPNGLNEDVESRLVRINGVHFTGSGNFTSGTWNISTGPESTNIYLAAGHPLIGTPVPQGPVDITGIASQHDNNPPYLSGYQLLPRGSADITPHAQIAILPPVVQDQLVPDGFTLNWSTNISGTTEAFYGPTPAYGAHSTGMPGTTHQLQLTGLQPASFHYVLPFSVDGSDTAFAAPMYCSTASTSSGAIKVYFTKNTDTSVSSGEDAIGLFGNTDDTLKAYVDRAQHTLDVAMYNTNSQVLVQAVNAAHARGVQVRWIAEGGNANTALASLNAGIPVLYRQNSAGSGMHNKFFIIDAEDPQRAMVMGGSCNWTTQSFFLDFNNIVLIQDQALARCYRMEFEEMWGGSGPGPVPALSRFGADKTDNTPHLFNVGGVPVEVFFSPSDGTTARIQKAVDDAAANLRFALLIFTEYSLGQAVLAAHNRTGMVVQGDVEDVFAIGSRFTYLANNGVQMFSHAGEDGLLHHKYAIVDEGTAGDPLVVTGSHNWTASAENVNDENILVIHDARVANLFYQEWMARHNAVASLEEEAAAGFRLYPNPASDRIIVQFAQPPSGSSSLVLLDLQGRVVQQWEGLDGPVQIPVRQLPTGLHALQFRSAQGVWTERFMKE